MMKSKFHKVLQAATDKTDIPLELEAIDWALTERYTPSKAFSHSVRKYGLDGKIGVGAWLKGGGEYSKHVLEFDPQDWNKMTLKQQRQVGQLLERIIQGAQHMKRGEVIVQAASMH